MSGRIHDVTRAPLRRGPRVFAALAACALLAGCGGGDDPAPAPDDAVPAEADVIATVEGVEGGEITGADLEAEVLAAAEAQGQTPPTPGSPDFDLLAGDALDQLLLRTWIAGDVAEQGGEVSEEEAAALAGEMDPSGLDEMQATWGPRTECDTEVISRLCAGGGGDAPPEPPPDIPPASGLEEPPG